MFYDKLAVVTGASGGIGSAIAESFARRGYSLALLYNKNIDSALDDQKSLEVMGVRAVTIQCDVASYDSCDNVVKELASRGLEPSVLVNCAGVSLYKTIADTEPSEFSHVMQVNMGGVFNMTKAVLPSFLRRQRGSIVNISSMWGVCGASCETVYSASKAAVIGFTKASAKELAPSGIRVNCIAPGLIDTKMNSMLSESDLQALVEETPLGRIGRPRDIGEAAVFLAESDFITGQVLTVDGGFIL